MEEDDGEWWVEKSSPEESKVKLILRKGWLLGKKIAVTGVAVTSAPFVLPPLFVYSTLGLAFSIPFGLFFASYACTEKIMSELFPVSVSPKYLEYITCCEAVCDKLEEGMYREEEEEELVEDMKRELETRAEMVEDWKSKFDAKEEVDGSLGNFQEEDGGVLEREKIMEEHKKEEGIINNAFEFNLEDETKRAIVEERGNDKGNMLYVEPKEMPVRKTTMVMDENRNAEHANNDSMAEEKLAQEMKGTTTIGERGDHGDRHVIEQEAKEAAALDRNGNVMNVSMEVREEPTRGRRYYENVGNGRETRSPEMGESRGRTEEKRNETDAKGRKNTLEGEFKGEREEKRREEHEYNNKEPGAQPIEEMETSTKQMKGMTETKRDEEIIEDTKVSIMERSTMKILIIDSEGAKSKSKSNVEIAHAVVNPISSNIADDTSSAKGNFLKDTTKTPSIEILGEKQIWEKIDAMRTIVGYKATPNATCIEELKALYLFTGVEPPPSSKESSDLQEVNHKLQFLMSIVGVK